MTDNWPGSFLTPPPFWLFALLWFLFNVGVHGARIACSMKKASKVGVILSSLFVFAPLFVLFQQVLDSAGKTEKDFMTHAVAFAVVALVTWLVQRPLARLLMK